MTSGATGAGIAFDVAVVGAGPAGAATARFLAQRGLGVVLLERTRFEAPRIGESLAPNVQESLRWLGLWPQFLSLAPLPSWGTKSVWGGTDVQSHSHLSNPYGQGWHIDRCAFDRMLADGAAATGARLITGVTVRQCAWRDGAWEVRTQPDRRFTQSDIGMLRVRMLIDATGRTGRIARSLGVEQLRFDRMVGVSVRWAGVAPAERAHLLVEAVECGWWYSAPLPDAAGDKPGAMVAMIMTDADLCAQRRLRTSSSWAAALDTTAMTGRRLAGARGLAVPQVYCAHSQYLRRAAGNEPGPWLAVGDVALAVDPVSGSGVLRALQMAKAAARAAETILERPCALDPIVDYQRARDEDCAQYLVERSHYYAVEQRFEAPFWRRRQSPMQDRVAIGRYLAEVAF